MASPLGPIDRPLVVVIGKGGVGKSTVAAALAVSAARRGRRPVVVEVAGRTDVGRLVGRSVAHRSIDPSHALADYLRDQLPAGPRSPGLLAHDRTLGLLAAAAPGLPELLTIGKVWSLTGAHGRHAHDMVVLDAPATGHGVALLAAPRTFAEIAAHGPVRRQAEAISAFLTDRRQTGVVVVGTPRADGRAGDARPAQRCCATAPASRSIASSPTSCCPTGSRRASGAPWPRPRPARLSQPRCARTPRPGTSAPSSRGSCATWPRCPSTPCRSCSRPPSAPTTSRSWPTCWTPRGARRCRRARRRRPDDQRAAASGRWAGAPREHPLGELDEPARVAPLVVVPGDDLDLGAVDDARQRRVEDRRVRRPTMSAETIGSSL